MLGSTRSRDSREGETDCLSQRGKSSGFPRFFYNSDAPMPLKNPLNFQLANLLTTKNEVNNENDNMQPSKRQI